MSAHETETATPFASSDAVLRAALAELTRASDVRYGEHFMDETTERLVFRDGRPEEVTQRAPRPWGPCSGYTSSNLSGSGSRSRSR